MAFDLFKFLSTGNGEAGDPTPKPSPKGGPSSSGSQLDKMSTWDKIAYGQNNTGQARYAEDKARESAPKRTLAPSNPRPKPAAAAPPNKLGEMSVWDKFLYGQSNSGQAQFADAQAKGETPAQQSAAQAERKEKWNNPQSRADLEQGQGTVVDFLGAADRGLGSGQWLTEGGALLKTNQMPGTEKQLESKGRQVATTELGGENSETYELTWDQYNALPPRARAAVDANTMLVNAAREDREAAITADEGNDIDQGYFDDVKAMFGEQGGSDLYALSTLRALQQLGISDTKSGDLDNYLNGSALITEADLAGLSSLAPGAAYEGTDTRAKNAATFSDKALSSLSQVLSDGNNLLSGIGSTHANSQDLDQLFEMLSSRQNFDSLKDGDVSEVLGLFLAQTPGVTPDTLSRYFEDRLNRFDYNAATGKPASMGVGAPESYISPAEFRGRYYAGGK